ncbi:DUF3618 domain-containing protein [Azotobacter vinelandii]
MSTQSRIDLEAQKGPETLEQEIDRQRAEISNIVHALEKQAVPPGELLDRALGYTKGHGGEFMSNLTNTVAANPLPTVLTSIGLLWLMTSQNRAPASQAHVDEASMPQGGPSLTEKGQAAGRRHSREGRAPGRGGERHPGFGTAACERKRGVGQAVLERLRPPCRRIPAPTGPSGAGRLRHLDA